MQGQRLARVAARWKSWSDMVRKRRRSMTEGQPGFERGQPRTSYYIHGKGTFQVRRRPCVQRLHAEKEEGSQTPAGYGLSSGQTTWYTYRLVAHLSVYFLLVPSFSIKLCQAYLVATMTTSLASLSRLSSLPLFVHLSAASFNLYQYYDSTTLEQAYGVSATCIAALNSTVDCDYANSALAAQGPDLNCAYPDLFTPSSFR